MIQVKAVAILLPDAWIRPTSAATWTFSGRRPRAELDLDQRASRRGRFIDVSLLESTLAAMGWVVSNHLNGGVFPEPMGNENFTAAPSGTFKTKTGPLNISANEQKQFETLCELIGRPDLPKDERYSDRQARKLRRNELNEEINRALQSKSAEEWETLLNVASVPAGCVLSVQDALRQLQIVGRAFVEILPDEPVRGHALRVTRPGFLLDEPFPPPSSPPVLGAHTAVWLARAGYSPAEIDDMARRGVVHAA